MNIAESHSASSLAATDAADDHASREALLPSGGYLRAKPWLDRVLAWLLLVPALPLMGGLILLIRCTSRGPGVYRQVRVGKGGRNFTMYKLRSMRLDAEAKSGPAWSAPGSDPRVTRLGYWLRRLHLDLCRRREAGTEPPPALPRVPRRRSAAAHRAESECPLRPPSDFVG